MFLWHIQRIIIVNHEIANIHQVHDKENKMIIEVHKKGKSNVAFTIQLEISTVCYKPFFTTIGKFSKARNFKEQSNYFSWHQLTQHTIIKSIKISYNNTCIFSIQTQIRVQKQ